MNNLSRQYRRLPAEWEPQEAVFLSWPHVNSDWNYMLEEIQETYIKLATELSNYAKVIIIAPDIKIPLKGMADKGRKDNIFYVEIPTNDTWIRDYGPISVSECDKKLILDFCFNGWGLKFASDKDNQVTIQLSQGNLFNASYTNRLGFVLEGGSIESDGKGTIMTTARCLLSTNRNGQLTRREIEQCLKQELGAKNVLWLESGALEGDDTDSHIDTLARLAPDNTIVYVGRPDDKADSHFAEMEAMKNELKKFRTNDGNTFRLIALPFPEPIFDLEGNRLPATYANYLTINNAVLVPTYNQPENDQKALNAIKSVFPDKEIIGIDCTALIQQHGSLHCATMQIPTGFLNNPSINIA
ncbi:MAG: agmatine deiminase family protein [Muribaculum sp.]|nr:agmatine deiminase family protein [Muribaculaceae bacterium]MCM1081094.1 agmatine deiminase family protein [Muribaculum sp.]